MIKRNNSYNIVKTLDNEVITQSNTAFNFGTRFIVFNGRNTRRTRKDLIVFKFLPAPFSLKCHHTYIYYFLSF
jgi:hypothetical protein